MNKKCDICGFSFHEQSGKFTKHLEKEHNISLREYIIKYELSGVTPKCKCGYCEEDAPFFRGKFLDRIGKHQKYEWLKDQYIKKSGVPKCINCGKDVKWNRGVPNKYCSPKCFPNQWNQEKVKETVKYKYNVDNVSFLNDVKDKISNSNKKNYKNNKKEIVKKFIDTCLDKYDSHPMLNDELIKKYKNTMIKNYGVDHPSKTLKFRDNSSKRMIENNSKYNFKEYYKVKKYKDTELYYQSSYEYHFLEYCEKHDILDKVKNGNVYDFLPEERDYGFRTITDFSIGDIEIEIKSKYILEKQGGYFMLNIKQKAVERLNKKYLLIIDKDYSELENILDSYK